MIRISLLSLFIFASFANTFAQDQVADKIIAVVGKKIILQSELDQQFESEKNNNPNFTENEKCYLFYTLIAQQVLVEQAGRDSIIVTEEEVNGELERRIRTMVQNTYGSVESLEAASGKSVYQLKESYRNFFRDKLTAEQMQAKLMQNVKITPNEVSAFFNKFPKDSLPPIPATAELGQIVINPKINPIVEKLTKERLEDIRKEIVAGGKEFSTMASIYNADDSKNDGGLLKISRKGFDAQFVAAAYRLQPGEISPVIRSKFGFHIIKMEKRMGDDAMVRHIILVPEITSIDINTTIKKLDSVRADLISGKIEFNAAVAKYSNDEQSQMNGGMVTDAQNYSTLRIEGLQDAQLASAISTLTVGEYSQPQIFTNPYTGAKSCRILRLKTRTEPHILNLTDDYSQIQEKALLQKQNEYLHNWLGNHIGSYYVKIDPEYQSCPDLKGWDNSKDVD